MGSHANETEQSQELQQVISKGQGHLISLLEGVGAQWAGGSAAHTSWGISEGHTCQQEVKWRLISNSLADEWLVP